MKHKKQFLFYVLLAVSSVIFSARAHASVTPTLNLAATGNGDSVQINVNGDPNASVIFYYTPSSSVLQIKAIGTTNSSGLFSNTVSSASYGLTTGNPTYVSVGGINGLVSSIVAWPTVNTTASNPVTLNQTALVLSVGQTSSVIATNSTQNSLYVSNNSNSSVASAAVNGNQITILALTSGSAMVTICSVGNTTNCPSVNVTVQGGGAQALTFSQSNISLAYGQSTTVTINGGTGTYMVSNNSSSGNVTTSINGNILTLGGNNSVSGVYSITVCSTNVSSCGVVTVTLGGTTSTNVTFSQSAPILTVGQSMNVTIYGNTATTYYVSSNSNPSVVQSNVSGSTLTLLGSTAGTATIMVCASSGGCGSLTITVSGNTSAGLVSLAQNSLTLALGQTSSVAISGGTAPYVLLTSSNDMFQAGISGSALYVTGVSVGSAQITVCSSSNTSCASLSLQVTGTQSNTNSTIATSFLNFSSASPVLNLGQTTSISLSGGQSNSYTIAYNSNSNIVQASTNANLLSLYGVGNGHAIVVACDSSSDCGALPIVVGVSNTSTNTNTNSNTTSGALPSGCSSSYGFSITTGLSCSSGVSITPPPAATKYQFTLFLKQGMTGNEVLELQKRLTDLGYYYGPANGNFGPLTAAGVSSLQRAHNISAVGYVGPSTRSVLNAY